jgi:hypothetical protein
MPLLPPRSLRRIGARPSNAPLRLTAILAALVLGGCAAGPGSSPAGTPGVTPGGPIPSLAARQACGSAPQVDPTSVGWGQPASPPRIIPFVIANPGEVICGTNRVLLTFIDGESNVPVGAPDRTASMELYDLGRDPNTPFEQATGTFVWAIENQRGDYIFNLSFPEAGAYGAAVTTAKAGGAPDTIRISFDVEPTNGVVKVGDKAPSTPTPTAASVGGDLSKISTDTSPDPAFYQVSEDQALAQHKPFVMIFATPKFCTSAQCGPTLDRIKPYAAKYPSVAFIHVEPYKLTYSGGSLQAVLDESQNLIPSDVTNTWGLLSEPWVFVVDRNGIVRASLELIFSDQELTAALDAVK